MVLSIKDRLAARKHGAKYIKLANKELTRLNTRRQVLRLFPVVDEADVEHASAKELIHQLEGMQPGTITTMPKSSFSGNTSATT